MNATLFLCGMWQCVIERFAFDGILFLAAGNVPFRRMAAIGIDKISNLNRVKRIQSQ